MTTIVTRKVASKLPVDPFVRNVASQYGVKLTKGAAAAVAKVFSSPALIADTAKFTPAITSALAGTLKGRDAKSLKSIAGMANRFRSATIQDIDVNRFLGDLMERLPNNLKLSNAIFGARQGGRIATALGDPEVLNSIRDLVRNHADGYAKKISDERMAGFDGALSRLEGSIMNLQTSVGRAFDAEGKGGGLTSATSALEHRTLIRTHSLRRRGSSSILAG